VRTIKVSERDLMFALTNRMPGTTHYLDADTGEVVPVFGFNRDKILSEVRREPGRYLRLAPQTGAEGIHIMADFIRTVSQHALRRQLEAAISGEHPFAKFRHLLKESQPEYRRWLQFRRMVSVQSLREKLLSRGVDLNFVPDQE
jgi:hypothetical protein